MSRNGDAFMPRSAGGNYIIEEEFLRRIVMLYSLWKYKLLLVLIIVFFICSQVIPGVILSHLLAETGNMASTQNQPLKQCRLKYINCCQLNGRVVNTSVFVDRFIRKLTFAGISLSRISHLAGQMMMLSILVTGIGVCRCLSAGGTLFQIIPYYVISILELYLYFTLSGAVDIAGRKEALKIELTDYLENHLLPRLQETMQEDAFSEDISEGKRVFLEKESQAAGAEENMPEGGRLDLSQIRRDELEELLRELIG